MFRIYDHKNNVHMIGFDKYMTNPDWIKLACSSKAALDDGIAQRISEQQQSLFYTKRAKQHAPVGVVFHAFSHGNLIDEIRKWLLRKREIFAAEQRKGRKIARLHGNNREIPSQKIVAPVPAQNSSPGTGTKIVAPVPEAVSSDRGPGAGRSEQR